MQRKNNFLNPSRQRPAIAMIMALSTIVTLATIMALSLSFTAQTSKRTTDLYLREQSILYSKSVAELALLRIARDGCTNNFNQNFDNGIYNANVIMRYIYDGPTTDAATGLIPCTIYTNNPAAPQFITTPEQNGSVLMDITISTNAGTEPIRYFRRSIQKL